MREIIKNGVMLARHITQEDIKPGLNFFSKDEEFIQVGVWGHYEKDKELKAHIHNTVERMANRTYEALYVINGYFIKEEDTNVLEIKNGPYLCAEIDRRRI